MLKKKRKRRKKEKKGKKWKNKKEKKGKKTKKRKKQDRQKIREEQQKLFRRKMDILGCLSFLTPQSIRHFYLSLVCFSSFFFLSKKNVFLLCSVVNWSNGGIFVGTIMTKYLIIINNCFYFYFIFFFFFIFFFIFIFFYFYFYYF